MKDNKINEMQKRTNKKKKMKYYLQGKLRII